MAAPGSAALERTLAEVLPGVRLAGAVSDALSIRGALVSGAEMALRFDDGRAVAVRIVEVYEGEDGAERVRFTPWGVNFSVQVKIESIRAVSIVSATPFDAMTTVCKRQRREWSR